MEKMPRMSTSTQRVLAVLVLLAVTLVSGGCGRARDRNSVVDGQLREQQILEDISARYSADYSWVEQTKRSELLTQHLLTTDLERILVIGRPIVFVGQLADQVRLDQDYYELLLIPSIFDVWTRGIIFQVRCPIGMVDDAHRAIPGISSKLSRGAVFILVVDRVVSGSFPNAASGELVASDTRVGVGSCVAIEPLRSSLEEAEPKGSRT